MMRPMAGLLVGAVAAPALAFTVPPIMPVYSVKADLRGVTVRLASESCPTLKSDLTVAVAKSDTRPMLLIARKQAHSLVACSGTSGPADITWSYADLGLEPGQPFSLANPLTREP